MKGKWPFLLAVRVERHDGIIENSKSNEEHYTCGKSIKYYNNSNYYIRITIITR